MKINYRSTVLLFIIFFVNIVYSSSDHNDGVTAKNFLLFIKNRANYLTRLLLTSNSVQINGDTIVIAKSKDIKEKLSFPSDSIFTNTKETIDLSDASDSVNQDICTLTIFFTDSTKFSLPQSRCFKSDQLLSLNIPHGKKYHVKLVEIRKDKDAPFVMAKRLSCKESTLDSTGVNQAVSPGDSTEHNYVGNWSIGMSGEWSIEEKDESESEIGMGFAGATPGSVLDPPEKLDSD
jgi:hypothetical protein